MTASTPPFFADRAARLDELRQQVETVYQASKLNPDRYGDCARSGRGSSGHWDECARLMVEAKNLAGHGTWLPWLRTLSMSYGTARKLLSDGGAERGG